MIQVPVKVPPELHTQINVVFMKNIVELAFMFEIKFVAGHGTVVQAASINVVFGCKQAQQYSITHQLCFIRAVYFFRFWWRQFAKGRSLKFASCRGDWCESSCPRSVTAIPSVAVDRTPNLPFGRRTLHHWAIFLVGGWRMYPFTLPLLPFACMPTQSCKRASFWRMNRAQARTRLELDIYFWNPSSARKPNLPRG